MLADNLKGPHTVFQQKCAVFVTSSDNLFFDMWLTIVPFVKLRARVCNTIQNFLSSGAT